MDYQLLSAYLGGFICGLVFNALLCALFDRPEDPKA
jgi:hypothetical protein